VNLEGFILDSDYLAVLQRRFAGHTGASRVEARVHGAEPAAHGGAQRKLNNGKARVSLTGASLAEGGWRVR